MRAMRKCWGILGLCVVLGGCADAPDPSEFNAGVKAYDAHDYRTAFHIFRELAPTDMAAARNLALMLRNGEGLKKKNPEEARMWMTQAAEGGLATAQADLGEMLLDGEGGPADPEAALPWLQSAAKANHPIAQFQLGEIYEAGQVVPKDLALAKKYYAAAAAAGVTAARDRLAELNGMAAEPVAPPAH
jgi:TPR repeat protein